MDPELLATFPDPQTAASPRERAMAVRHREPARAAAVAARAVEGAADGAGRRRARAALGACLSMIPAEVLRGREILLEVLAGCEAAGDDGLRCEVLNELAASHGSTYATDEALRYAREAAELSRRLSRRGEEVRALRLQGVALTRRGDFVEALGTLLEALALHEARLAGRAAELDDEERWERGELFGGIAVVYSNMDQCTQALHYYRVALESFGERFPASAARTLYRMGIAAEELDDGAAAEEYYGQSLELYERQGDAAGAGLGRLGLSKILLSRGAADEAEAAIRQALAALAGDPVYLGYYTDAVWVMGDVHQHHGRNAEALACYQEALGLFQRTQRPASHLAHLHQRFSRVYAALGRWEEALREHERFYALRVEHLREQATARMAAMMVQFDTERALKDREIHRVRSIELEREIAERKEVEAALARAQAELEERNRELHALSIRDPLTGAFNRRYLDQRLAEALPLAARGVQPLSVMICDLDDFKRVNDTFSHAVGDEVLRTVAGILRQHVRASDVVARLGGEEFVVLFPATTLGQAAAAAEKIRARVRDFGWDDLHPGVAVTLSAGVAQAGDHPTHETLLAEADGKLYEAKRRGKDCVVG
jgi:diguanylate cyclase (GGDEF)-like protein